MFGIKGYNPRFYSNCKDFMFHNKNLIRELIGQKLIKIHWVCEVSTGEWFKDFPVVLELDGGYLSLCANKYSDFSMGMNNIDFGLPLDWYGVKDFDLQWKEYKTRKIENVKNQPIESIEIVNFLPRFISDYPLPDKKEAKIFKKLGFLHGVGFNFGSQTMVVINGLDDNNIVFFERDFPNYYTRIIINE